MAGLRLPIESHVLQAFVSEGIKPLIDGVITFGAGHFYISQSDKGGLVFGGDIDGYNSYAQRGNLPVVEDVMEGGMAMMPMLGRLRVLRQWGGIMDMIDGRLADHRPHADRGPLSQCRLVLWRLQGDAGVGLVLRPPDRARRAASGGAMRSGSIASPPARLLDEKGRRRAAESSLRHAHSLSALRRARQRGVLLSRRRRSPARPDGCDRRSLARLRLSARQSGGQRMREFWHHVHGCRRWLMVTRDTRTHAITALPWTRAHDAARALAA